MRASAASYGAPTSFQSRTASEKSRSARRGVALGEPHPSSGEGGAGDQRLALESGGDELQLVGGRSGPVDVAGRDLDLDLRLEQRRALQVGVRWRSFDGTRKGRSSASRIEAAAMRHVSSGQLHQRETGLRDPTRRDERPARLPPRRRCLLCAADPSELVQRPSELASQVRAQLLARQERSALGLVARPAQPEDLGAVDPAAPVQAADGVGLAPPLHRLGPFLGDVVLGESLQGADELAVDDPRRERIEVAGDRRHPGLVEQRQALAGRRRRG